jgi:hypothetical protein
MVLSRLRRVLPANVSRISSSFNETAAMEGVFWTRNAIPIIEDSGRLSIVICQFIPNVNALL